MGKQKDEVTVDDLRPASPSERLKAMLAEDLPPSIRRFWEVELSKFLHSRGSKALRLFQGGPGLKRDEMRTILSVYTSSMKMLDDAPGHKTSHITATVRQAGEEIAEAIDSAVSRSLITARNERWVNHAAYLDILEGHALIVAGLAGLQEVPDNFNGVVKGSKSDESDKTAVPT